MSTNIAPLQNLSANRARRSPRWSVIVRAVALALVLAGAVLSCWQAWTHAHARFQIDYEEGNVLNSAVRIAQGQSPYPNPKQWPSVINPYGPVGYWLASLAVSSQEPAFYGSRMLMMLAALFAAGCIVWLVHHWTRRWGLAVACGAVFLVLPQVQDWLPLLRVDFPALLLTLLGLIVFERMPRFVWLAGIFFTVAIFAKYSLIAAPLSCGLMLLLRRRWMQWAQLTTCVMGLSGVWFWWMQYRTNGFFAFHMLRSHPDPSTWDHSIWIFSSLWPIPANSAYHGLVDTVILTTILLIPLVLFGLWSSIAVGEEAMRPSMLPFCYLAVATAIAAATAAKLGSNMNHLLEPLAAAVVCAGIGWDAMRQRLPQLGTLTAVIAAALAIWLPSAWYNSEYLGGQIFIERGCGAAYEYVRQSPAKRILSSNVGALVVNRKEVFISNPFVYGQLVQTGNWPDVAGEMMRRREFDLLILDGNPTFMQKRGDHIWSPGFYANLMENYRMTHQFACMQAGGVYERVGSDTVSGSSAGKSAPPANSLPHGSR